MPEKVIDGKAIAAGIKEELKRDLEILAGRNVTPGLAAVLVGDNPASHIYVRNKARECKKIGIYSEVIERPADFPQAELNALIDGLNARTDIHGILIQSPLPKPLSELEAVLRVNPKKDVDGFHPMNVGLILRSP